MVGELPESIAECRATLLRHHLEQEQSVQRLCRAVHPGRSQRLAQRFQPVAMLGGDTDTNAKDRSKEGIVGHFVFEMGQQYGRNRVIAQGWIAITHRFGFVHRSCKRA